MRQRFVLDTAITDSGLRVKEGWQGILDSSPDLDVLLGQRARRSERMGLRFVEASKFPRMLKEYLMLIEEGESRKIKEEEEEEELI